jgi:1-deoxy-D-xylulose 5-phosphate reductoisomerase
MHFYMVSATIHYLKGDQPKQKSFNLVMQAMEKKITAMALNNARQAMFQRLMIEDDIPIEDMKNIIFNTFSHLGFMTQKEFNDVKEEDALSH